MKKVAFIFLMLSTSIRVVVWHIAMKMAGKPVVFYSIQSEGNAYITGKLYLSFGQDDAEK